MTEQRAKIKFSADDYNRLVSDATTSKVVYIQERRNFWYVWTGKEGDGGQGLINNLRVYETEDEAIEAAKDEEIAGRCVGYCWISGV